MKEKKRSNDDGILIKSVSLSAAMDNFSNDIRRACDVLRQGGVILYPTDTVWGIGCDATDEAAVQKVFALKRRDDRKAMLVLIDSAARLETYVRDVPDVAWDLIELADKPLTIIYDGAKNLAPGLLGEDGSVGIRVTRETFSQQLCKQFRKPLVSTSANISGQPSPATFAEISEEIRGGVDYIVEYRRDEKTSAKPSGIIRLGEGNMVQIIRK